MNRWVQSGLVGLSLVGAIGVAVRAETPLSVVYPPDGHETTAAQIFLIGTAPATGDVTVNGQTIERSPAGHFSPSFPLQLGENVFTLRHGSETLTLRVTRQSSAPPVPQGMAFAEGSLTPAIDIARLPGELICFGAIAPANATVAVNLQNQTIPLLPQTNSVELPPNSAVLTNQNQPTATVAAQSYQGCTAAGTPSPSLTYSNPLAAGVTALQPSANRDLGYPEFRLTVNGQTIAQPGTGKVEILSSTSLPVIEVTADSGTARSGPSTDYSRLTPLPKGTRATVTGREGEWLRLDYGAWIRASDTQVVPNAAPPQSLIRSVSARSRREWTEIRFPLQVPVPVSVDQGDRTFTLTLHNTTAQTDTILMNDDPIVERLDWQQVAPGQVQYRFNLKSAQQWGYKLRYDGTTLVLSLKHPPRLTEDDPQSLAGISIVLDPGHGGPEDLGARGPNGYPEKAVALLISQMLRDRLVERGATVYMTREEDIDLDLPPRVDLINRTEPTIALSLHYNALPDDGDAENTAGVGMFWYQAQAHDLAVFLHHYLVRTLDRPSYGVFWNNLALTRPAVAPAVLLELGFMINPNEFEWITNEQEQEKLADALADGVTEWLRYRSRTEE